MNAQIQKLMEKLGCTEEEALDIMAEDEEIDHGAKLYSLTPEQEKESKKARSTTGEKKPTVYKFEAKRRKDNPVKKEMIDYLVTSIRAKYEISELEIKNDEREIEFRHDGIKYRLTLALPREKKS